jgi:hypothetical protein
MRWQGWTREAVGTLRSGWSALSASEIAKKLGCTRNAVIGKANRMGLPAKCEGRTAHPLSRAFRAATLYRAGLQLKEIAQKMGVKQSAIPGLVRRGGGVFNRKKDRRSVGRYA